SIAGKLVCHDLDLVMRRGECWGLLGSNGVGKTTLLHTLAGLRRADSGLIHLNGIPLYSLPRRDIARRLGVLLQEQLDPFPGTVLERILQGRHPHLGRWDWEGADDFALADQALEQVGLRDLAGRQIATLSGGEKQRVAIATLLTQAPDLYLLDEPVNHLDLHHQIALLDLLADKRNAAASALMMILHDINLAARYCDHILLLYGDGAIKAGPRHDILTRENLSTLYQHEILSFQGPHGPGFLPA
ncbi:MAG: hypothetical protein A2V90_00315, partial [Gammaproteobacteria bacterium RBG_16_57_12]